MAAITSGSASQRFRLGMTFPFKAFRYLRAHPPLWGWVALPAAINLVLLVLALIGSWMAAPQLVGWLWSRPADGLALAIWVMTIWVARLALAGVMGMAVYLAAGIFAAPFNEVISERVEELELGASAEPWTVVDFVRDTTVSVFHSLGSLAIYVACMLPLLLLNIIPGLGSILFTVASWTLTAFFLAREMLDGATSRRRMSFKAKLDLVNQHRPLMGGFGFAQNLLLWIPLANFVCLPIGVIGGTLLYIELERAGLAPTRKRLR